jgi:hypothetical protein
MSFIVMKLCMHCCRDYETFFVLSMISLKITSVYYGQLDLHLDSQ